MLKKIVNISIRHGINNNFSMMINKYNSMFKDFKKYLKAVQMLITDAYYLNKKRFITVIITSGAGITMLGFSLGLLLKYVKHLESNSPMKYIGYHFYPRDGFVLVSVSIFSMLLLILSAGLLLYSRLRTIDMLVEFNLTALSRVAEKFGWNPPNDIAWVNDTTLRSNIRTLYTSDSQKSAMAMRRLAEGYQHFLTAFGGIAVLVWLDAAATLYLILIILFSLIYYVKVNKRASNSTRNYENRSGDSNRRSRSLLDNLSTWPNPDFNPAVLRSITHEGTLREINILLFDRFATRSLTEFLSYVLTATSLSCLVLTLGYSAMQGKKSWAAVVGYIVVLQMVMKAFKTLSKVLTDVSRIYPGLKRLYDFNKKSRTHLSHNKINELNLVFSNDALTENNKKQITIHKGDIIGFSAPVSLSRYSITFFEKVITGGKQKRKKNIAALLHSASIAVPLQSPIIPITIRELLGIPADVGTDELRNAAGSQAHIIEKEFPLEPDTIISNKTLNKLPREALIRFSLLSCILSDKPVLFVDNTLVTEKWLREFKSILKNRILIVCFSGLPDKQISSKTDIKIYISAAADCTIVASGSFSFIKKRRTAVQKILKEHLERLVSKSEKMIVLTDVEDEDDD